MASQLKVDTLTGVTTAGSIDVTGEGNSTTTNLQQGLAKSWCHFNGSGTVAIQDSFNVASLTDRGTGLYTVLFTNDMGNANHCSSGSVKKDDSNDDANIMIQIGGDSSYTTVAGEIRVLTKRVKEALDGVNATEIKTITHGDLA